MNASKARQCGTISLENVTYACIGCVDCLFLSPQSGAPQAARLPDSALSSSGCSQMRTWVDCNLWLTRFLGILPAIFLPVWLAGCLSLRCFGWVCLTSPPVPQLFLPPRVSQHLACVFHSSRTSVCGVDRTDIGCCSELIR